MKIDVSDMNELEIMVHAEKPEEPSKSVELEKVSKPHEGVAIMDHEEYEGPEITLTVGGE